MVVWLVLIYKEGRSANGEDDTLISTEIYDNEASADKNCTVVNNLKGVYAICEQYEVIKDFEPGSFMREFYPWDNGKG